MNSAAVVVLLLLACSAANAGGGAERPEGPTVMRLGHVVPHKDPWHAAAQKFSADVYEKTRGAVRIDVYGEGRLGGELEILEDLRRGIIELTVIGTGTAAQKDSRLNVFSLPFLFRDRAHLLAVIDGRIGDEILFGLVDSIQIRGLAFWLRGARHLTNSKRPISCLEDLKGLRIRVPVEQLATETWKALGTVPVPIAFEKVSVALTQDLVDGQENPISVIASSNFFDFQKHLALTGHVMSPAILAMSEKRFAKLRPEFRRIFYDAAKDAAAYEASLVEKEERMLLETAREKGVVVTIPDKVRFVEALEAVNRKYAALAGMILYEKIVSE